ncbi:FAD-dependent oxidoreductase [Pedobacter hartonius]|uniref:Flavin-dependent monooxygenase n=1 Tax=Pedobacter hartonius TaxID=425514 RepID=A0A1H4BU52_9SPHI|nr:NAD(P)/FAD-dependent oxidoreductase [Pedobacter hartonius]SEA51613.1 2-polyprenyl-6-methoxyphenol hydroxylase [Pedobacter hartonius]
MLLQDKKVAIAGGGPGGLTLARLLQLKGANVKVYERDVNRQVRVQGATLDLHYESGLKALREAGLMETFKLAYRPGADRIRVTDEHARVYFDQHGEESNDDFGDPWFRPEIDRGPLRELLLDSLQPGTVIWDSYITGMEKNGEGWILNFHNGNSAEADIVIAADGANSKIRPLITPIKPFYSGITVVEGNIYDADRNAPHLAVLLKGGKIFAFGNSRTIILSSKGDGSIAFYTGFNTGTAAAKASAINIKEHLQVLEWFKEEYHSWDTVWNELFEHPGTSFTVRPLYCMPLDQAWPAQHNITMLGDAAHLMPPYAGEGVNMAMLDALELSEVLTGNSFTDTLPAIAHYEQQMLKRFTEVAGITLDNTSWMHSPEGLKKMLEMFNPTNYQ